MYYEYTSEVEMIDKDEEKNKKILKRAIKKAIKNGYEDEWENYMVYQIIFSHDFARAFWKDTPIVLDVGFQSGWCYHLQQMVLEEEPLKYLEKFL